MDSLDRLTELFKKFPGVGVRQAGRFVYYLLRSSPRLRQELIDAIRDLADTAKQCPQCFRYHSGKQTTCSMCADVHRDTSLLTVLASDADLAALERSGTYHGHYFVLGGMVSLASDSAPHLRLAQLVSTFPERIKNGLKEVVLAFPASPEGDATAIRVREHIAHLQMSDLRGHSFEVKMLGRGLSTGSELEYADPDTLRNAFNNRK